MHRAEGFDKGNCWTGCLTFVSLCDWHSGAARTTSTVMVGARLADAHCHSGEIAADITTKRETS
jgi:hypothetical protein